MKTSVIVLFICAMLVPFAASAQVPLDLWTLNGTNGFKVTGQKGGDRSGSGLASGDMNDDSVGGNRHVECRLAGGIGHTAVHFMGTNQAADVLRWQEAFPPNPARSAGPWQAAKHFRRNTFS